MCQFLYLDLAPNPQNRILGLYKPSPPTRTTELLGFEPAQAGFVCVAAISNRQVQDVSFQLAAYRLLPIKETLPSSLLPSAFCLVFLRSLLSRVLTVFYLEIGIKNFIDFI